MKPISIVSASLTITPVASQLLCGIWLASKGTTAEGIACPGKPGFGLSAAAVATSFMAIVLANKV